MSDDGYFDERIAARYDESAAELFDPAVVDPVVDFLAALAGDGRALELGVGTGRIALPLSQRGVPVHGIDLSTAMIARQAQQMIMDEALMVPTLDQPIFYAMTDKVMNFQLASEASYFFLHNTYIAQ